MKPTVSRIVHYVSAGSADGTYPSACRAAVVTEVQSNDGTGFQHVSLAILNPEGMHFRQNVQQSEPIHQPMTWHWPEREPEEAPVVHAGAALDQRDLRIDVYRSGEMQTVKVLHLPSGKSSTVTHRSALEAKAEALRLLAIELIDGAQIMLKREEETLMKQVSDGLRSIDEAREELGREPWGLPETS